MPAASRHCAPGGSASKNRRLRTQAASSFPAGKFNGVHTLPSGRFAGDGRPDPHDRAGVGVGPWGLRWRWWGRGVYRCGEAHGRPVQRGGGWYMRTAGSTVVRRQIVARRMHSRRQMVSVSRKQRRGDEEAGTGCGTYGGSRVVLRPINNNSPYNQPRTIVPTSSHRLRTNPQILCRACGVTGGFNDFPILTIAWGNRSHRARAKRVLHSRLRSH